MRAIFFLLFSFVANASENIKFSVGVDLFDSVSQNDKFNRIDSIFKDPLASVNKFSTGITFKPFDFSEVRFTYKTNALLNFAESYTTQGGYNLVVQSKAQSYIISHPVSRKIVPYIVASDITSITSINSGKNIITNGFMYGFGLTYIFLDNNGLSFTYFLPSETFNTKYSYGVSYSYFI
jgi:hypothetical protein